MKLRSPSVHALSAVAFLLMGACSSDPKPTGATGGAGTSGAAGTGAAGNGATGAAGTGTSTGAAGTGTSAGTAGDTGAAGTGGPTGVTGTGGAAGVNTGVAGTGGTGTAGATGTAGDGGDPPAPRPINVTPGGVYQGNGLRLDKSKPILGKLVLYLGGICGDGGAGGIESFVNSYGFHTYSPKTQSCVNGGDGNHQKYRAMLTDNDPTNDAEANRMVGDARMELWDGVDRVPFITVAKGQSIVEETVAALKAGMTQDPGGDWGYFLNADGTLRTSDVWAVGYSWGSQTWGMISSYVRFGRVICTSGPQAEGFPDAAWITHPSATPADRKFTLLGFNASYPSMDKLDIAPNTVTSMIDTTTKAGWQGPPINVKPGDKGPFAPGHQIAMVEPPPYEAHTPGGHTIFCTSDPMNGWAALCKYVFNVQ